jgi:hypothetical protein
MTAEAVIEKKPINRREFLNFAWLVSIGFFTVTTAGVTYLFSCRCSKKGVWWHSDGRTGQPVANI